MNACTLIQRLHQHRRWSNARIVEAVRNLPGDALRRPFEIGQGSIWNTLVHLMAAEFVWLEALQGVERPVMPGDVADRLPGNQLADGAVETLDELCQRWEELDRRWSTYLEGLHEASLGETVYKASTSSGGGRRFATTRADILLHVCTHAQYTTAQLVNMLRHVGCEPLPDVMLMTLARTEAARTEAARTEAVDDPQ